MAESSRIKKKAKKAPLKKARSKVSKRKKAPTKKVPTKRTPKKRRKADSDEQTRVDQEIEHLDKARKSGLLSSKEYKEALEVLSKQRASRAEKVREAAAKEKVVADIIGQPLQTIKGTQKYFTKIKKPKKVVVGPSVAEKPVLVKPRAVEPTKPMVRKPVEKPAVIENVKEMGKEKVVVKRKEEPTVAYDPVAPDALYKDVESLAEEQETNWRLGLAVLTIFLLILLYIKFTSFGTIGAVVSVDAYLDYTSQYSEESFMVLQEIKDQYGDQVWITYHILGDSNESRLASMAVSCADDQGASVSYLSYLFGTDVLFDVTDDFVVVASELNLDEALFTLCLEGDVKDVVYEREVVAAAELGIEYTPTLIINNKKVVGDVGYDAVVAVIDNELNSLG